MNPKNYESVLAALRKSGSMAFLELSTLCDIGETELREIVKVLERKSIIEVSEPDDIFSEIVTVRDTSANHDLSPDGIG